MRNPFFRFKQFVVWHDRCAMKVGTDGVLLGAWTEVGHARKVLDIGTGSGLIALMIAQRSNAEIVGIDIDAVAVGQAAENVKSSPWGNRVKIEQADITDFNGEKYANQTIGICSEIKLPDAMLKNNYTYYVNITVEIFYLEGLNT